MVKLVLEEERSCRCGRCKGQYTDVLNAWYKGGNYVVPLGFANNTLARAMNNQPEDGMGEDFTAFVIAKKCKTFIKKD